MKSTEKEIDKKTIDEIKKYTREYYVVESDLTFEEQEIRLALLKGRTQTLEKVKEKIEEELLFLEHIADMEHDQWIEFTMYMLRNLSDKNKARWYAQCETPYPELSNKEQESDRKFAKIIIEELLSQLEDDEVKE